MGHRNQGVYSKPAQIPKRTSTPFCKPLIAPTHPKFAKRCASCPRKSKNKRRRPNQSLKLTEGAVDDFAARQYAENDMISKYVRAMNNMELAARRRSLAPVR